MSSDAARLEALGQPEVTFRWRSHELTIPRAVEDWPLDLIRSGRYVDAALVLLNGQTAPVPLWRDFVSLSDAMAAAVGVERLPESPKRDDIIRAPRTSPKRAAAAKKSASKAAADVTPDPLGYIDTTIFGGVPLLLGLLDAYEDDIASDLKTYRNVDYLDRWRGSLSLRQIWVYIRRLPADSALSLARNGGHEPWSKTSIITAQLWEVFTQKPYVGRPMSAEEIVAARARQREQEQTMDTLAAKQDYYSPEASRARLEAARARKAQRATANTATNAAGAPVPTEPPPHALAALDNAMAARRRDMKPHDRKAV